jgi:hypothetical protein
MVKGSELSPLFDDHMDNENLAEMKIKEVAIITPGGKC